MMNSELGNHTSRGNYQVESVEKTESPDGILADHWYRYVIGRGHSKIEGLKAGTLQAVTEYAEAFARNINTRASGNGSTYNPARKRT